MTEAEQVLADISDMMANHVDNWPSPKKLKTAIALIGKTLDAMVPKDRQPDAVPGDLVRWGIEWDGPSKPVVAEKTDGYWTPWFIAAAIRAIPIGDK